MTTSLESARSVGAWVEHWARETPGAIALAERDRDGAWRQLSYRDTRRAIGAIAQSMIDMRLPDGAPVVVLSDNTVDHALMVLAAHHVGRPVCSVSSGYCRATRDYTRVRRILRMLEPALVYASDVFPYAPAVSETDAEVVFGHGAHGCTGALSFDSLLQAVETSAVHRAFEAVRPDDHAEYVLATGATGQPDAMVHTHRMLVREQHAVAQRWPFLQSDGPVLLDVLPWSHIDTGHRNLYAVLRNGGTLFVDEARLLPGQAARTARNLREVRPTLFVDVLHGIEQLLALLEGDAALARDFFARLHLLLCAEAELPLPARARLEAVARSVRAQPPELAASRRFFGNGPPPRVPAGGAPHDAGPPAPTVVAAA